MQIINFIYLLLFVFLMCLGQILFKKTALLINSLPTTLELSKVIEFFLSLFQIPYFFLALAVYASATIFWLFILQKLPLSTAYPFTALAMVIIPILSIFLFNEKVTVNYWIGAVLIVAGILIISFKS